MRIVAFIGDHVHVHIFEILHPELIVDEAADDVPLEQVGRTFAAEIGEGPFAMMFVREVGAFEERSEEHTSELQSLMRTSYAVFCLKKKKYTNRTPTDLYLIR